MYRYSVFSASFSRRPTLSSISPLLLRRTDGSMDETEDVAENWREEELVRGWIANLRNSTSQKGIMTGGAALYSLDIFVRTPQAI